MPEPVSILFLDLEGGWGGSSRSLFNLVSSLDRSHWNPIVILRKDGPVVQAYENLGITYAIEPGLPSFRPAERKNLLSYLFYLRHKAKSGPAMNRIAEIARENGCEAVHVNHESLALSGVRLMKRLKLPGIFHIRTELKPGVFARYVSSRIFRNARQIVFISEPVGEHFHRLVAQPVDPGRENTIYNICVPCDDSVPPPPVMNSDAALKVISLSNFSPNRGIDRIIDVAASLSARGHRDIEFYLFGKPAHSKIIGGTVSPYYSSLVDRVKEGGLEQIVHFPGHLPRPDGALNAGDVLIKLTRESNPWGRDIMEGMTAGLAVVSLGEYTKFVEPGVNGYLQSEYDADSIADYLVSLRQNPARREEVAKANTAKAKKLFGAEEISRAYGKVLRKAIGDSR